MLIFLHGSRRSGKNSSSLKNRQAWMGHADSTMIMDIYAKLTEERELQDTTRLDDYTKSRFSA